MKVVETEPAIKGASVSNVGKPAKMETGPHRAACPPFISEGDVIRIDTASGAYIERAQVGAAVSHQGPDPRRHRLDRGHHRQHVQRQERGADPPGAARADRAPEGAALQAADRRPLLRGRDRQPLRHEDAVAGGGARAREILDRGGRPDTEVVGIDEGQFFDAVARGGGEHAGEPGPARDRGRPRPGLPGPARSSPCRSSWRSPSTWTRRSPSACAAARPRTAPSGSWPGATGWWWGAPTSTRRAAAAASDRAAQKCNDP